MKFRTVLSGLVLCAISGQSLASYADTTQLETTISAPIAINSDGNSIVSQAIHLITAEFIDHAKSSISHTINNEESVTKLLLQTVSGDNMGHTGNEPPQLSANTGNSGNEPPIKKPGSNGNSNIPPAM